MIEYKGTAVNCSAKNTPLYQNCIRGLSKAHKKALEAITYYIIRGLSKTHKKALEAITETRC